MVQPDVRIAGESMTVPLARVELSALNTRKDLAAGTEDAGVDDLARSIAAQGLLSPPLLRRADSDRFEVIAGQRRVLACRQLGWTEIDARVVAVGDAAALAASLTENVQRADMHPMDKARALDALERQLGSRDHVLAATGLGASTVRRYLRLLDLPRDLQGRVGTGAGPVGVGFMAALAQQFPHADDAREVFERVGGFDGGVATEIVRRSAGDFEQVDALVALAAEGRLGLRRCGSSLVSCPYLTAQDRVRLGLEEETSD